MFRNTRTLTAAIVLTLVMVLHLPPTVEAAVAVGEPELIEKRHLGHRSVLYSYRLTIDNEGPGLDRVKVYVSCDAPNIRVIHGVVRFGNIEPHQVATGKHKFFVLERLGKRKHHHGDHPAPEPFDPACLLLELGHKTKLIISGVATDMPLSNAHITATVTRPASGRPIIRSGRPSVEEYFTTADVDGNYTIEVDTVTLEDFITLRADGTGEQSRGTLTSTVGSVDVLHTVGDDGSIVVGASAFPALDITHISTALAVLAEDVNGAPITTDAELAAAQSGVMGADLLNMSAVIKTVIDNANVVLPAGVSNTLELVSDPAAFEPFVANLEMNFPAEFAAATNAIGSPVQAGYDPAEVPGTRYFAQWEEFPFTQSAYRFEFLGDGTGSVVLFAGSSDFTWSVNADGAVVVELLDPPVSVGFPGCTYPGQTNTQCRALFFDDRLTLVRLVNGQTYDQVFVLRRSNIQFPDDPVPDEVFEGTTSADNLHLSFGTNGILPFQMAELSDTQFASYYYHQNNNSVGLNTPDLGADTLMFNAGGTGTTGRRNFVFNWQIDADGVTDIRFANGDSTRIVRFGVEAGFARTIVFGSLTNGRETLNIGRMFEPDGVPSFTEAMLLNRRYSNSGSIIDPNFTFDFLFLPGGIGCRTGLPLEWESTPENFMDSFLFLPFISTTIPFQRRSWEALAVVPGRLGDRYWVIENLDITDFTPGYVFSDPTVTPGRINSYEFTEDLTGVFDPCAP